MPTVTPSEIVLVFIGLVVLAGIAFEVYKYIKAHPQLLSELKTKVQTLETTAKATATSDLAAIHTKLDGLATQLTMVHAAVQAPVQLVVAAPSVAQPVGGDPLAAYKPTAAQAAARDAAVAAEQAQTTAPDYSLGVANVVGFTQAGQVDVKTFTLTSGAGTYRLQPSFDPATLTVAQNGVVIPAFSIDTGTARFGVVTADPVTITMTALSSSHCGWQFNRVA